MQRAVNNKDGGIYFDRSSFVYDKDSDSYRCPGGQTLTRKAINTKDRHILYTTSACGACALKPQCTGAKQRWVTRHFEEQRLGANAGAAEALSARHGASPGNGRASVREPKYRILDNGRFLLRGLRGASTEMAVAVLTYNSKRALDLLGPAKLHHELINQPV